MTFQRIRQQNFYVAELGDNTYILKSYNTIVGLINNGELFQVKYSSTTSKQVTQFANSLHIEYKYRNTLNSSRELQQLIKTITGLDIDTRYNCA